jgi:predicted ATPase with chaperone activity
VLENGTSTPYLDERWVRIRRPTIMAGGELTMQNLELTPIAGTGVCEAPLQLKASCGVLVIDDFGRQQMSPDTLLNRWIVPLETGYDFLNLMNGKKVRVPFDQMLVFSTNLEPRQLVDEAFLRRIPYKVEAVDPSEAEFIALLKHMAAKFDVAIDEPSIHYLLDTHYRKRQRKFRYCHPRDLLQQVTIAADFLGMSAVFNPELIDMAAENYFVDLLAK